METPTRAEISESDKWDLAHLFADVGKWQEDFAWIQKSYPRIKDWKGKIGQSAKNLGECLEFEKELDLKLERLYHFASLQLAEDSANTEYLARVGQIQNLLTKIGEAFAFVVPEIQAIDEQTFEQFYVEFQDHQYTLASSLAYSVKADVFRARARNYSSALDAALFPDDVPVSVYEGLIKSVRANLAPLFRYFELRRRVLALKELHHYDTYVPMVAEIDTHIPFDQAVEHVVTALRPIGKEYVDVLESGLRGRWCDRYETKGKRSGAFSSGSYGSPPFILMNYKEDVFADVYTLAHEAGHSMHTWFSQNSQLFQDYEYPIFLAEVASTFNEELLTHHLLQTTTDPKMRAYIINRQIDELRGTMFRQTVFAEFEKIIHAIEESGGALTLEVFKSEYHRLLETYFAENFTLDPELDLVCRL